MTRSRAVSGPAPASICFDGAALNRLRAHAPLRSATPLRGVILTLSRERAVVDSTGCHHSLVRNGSSKDPERV